MKYDGIYTTYNHNNTPVTADATQATKNLLAVAEKTTEKDELLQRIKDIQKRLPS